MEDKKKAGVAVGALALAGGLAFLMTRKPGVEPGKANLSGKVTDFHTGLPIPAVCVTIDGLNTQTNSGGNYQFTNLELGLYDITFEKAGYEPITL